MRGDQNQKDLFSNRSNLGSLQSSSKAKTDQQTKKLQTLNQISNFSQFHHPNVCEWQAVYIQGKFYLSDKQTIQRYLDIQNQLKQQRRIKEKVATDYKFKSNQNSSQVLFKPERHQRLFNLETIKVQEQSQSEKQKQEDQSLLNNLDTSSQNCSRLTFENQSSSIGPLQQPNMKRIDSISSISKSQKVEYAVNQGSQKPIINQFQNSNCQNNSKAISQEKGSQRLSQKKQSAYGYYLGINNEKIYSKKSENQQIQNLESFRQDQSKAQIGLSQPHEESQIGRQNSETHSQILKADSLKVQQKIQMPINLQTNRLKISSPFSSISSLSNPQKQSHLPQITEEKQQDHKRQIIQGDNSSHLNQSNKTNHKPQQKSVNHEVTQQINDGQPIRKKIELNQQRRFNSLPIKFDPLKIQTPSKISYKTYENIKYTKTSIDNRLQKNDSFFSNNQNHTFVDSSENENSFLHETQMPQKTKNLRTEELLSKLSELSKKFKVTYKSEKKDSAFQKQKNSHFYLSKKYQLPQIVLNSDKKSINLSKPHSIEQKYHSIEKNEQFKLLEKKDQTTSQQELSKSKIRLNGFIKNIKPGHLSELQFSKTMNSNQRAQNIVIQEDKNSKSKISHSIRSRSSFMTRHYKASSPIQKQEAEVFGQKKTETEIQVNLNLNKTQDHRKSSSDIGKIKHKDQNIFEEIGLNNEPQIGVYSNSNKLSKVQKIKKDTAVSANLDSEDKASLLNPQIKSLRQNKQILLQKLQNLQKTDLENQINQIKQSIKQIQINKLNKMAKTIDLQDHQEAIQIPSQQKNQLYELRLKSILQNIPETIQKLAKPSQIAQIKIPQELLLSQNQHKILPNMTPEQLQQVAIRVYKLFGIEHDPNYRPPSLLTTLVNPQRNLKKRQKLLIKKFKNCVFFDLVGGQNAKIHNKTIVWNFDNEQSTVSCSNNLKPMTSFYIGGWSQTVNSQQLATQMKPKQKHLGRGKKNGFGLEINQKFIYEGQYLNGKKHGQGKLYLIQSGYRYEGQFIENHKNGNAKEFNPFKNQIYVGQFKQDKRHGKGFLRKINLKNKSDRNKQLTKRSLFPYFFNGTFLNGNKQSGQEYFQSGDEYKGEYLNEMFHGKGVFKWMNGSQYDGQFSKNLKHGFGKWSSAPDQNTGAQIFYIGEFKMNKKEGEGKYIYKNGAYYQGSFENDLKHGSGALFYQDQNRQNKVLRGYWKHGNVVANQKGQIYKMKILKDQIYIQV